MFLTHRPNASEIEEFLSQSRELPLSYQPIGIAQQEPANFRLDVASCVIGSGPDAFARARQGLQEWRQFDFDWVDVFPASASTEPGTIVAVMVRHHLGLWSLNGCRIVYGVGNDHSSFGFAYGTLTNHAEMGEEIFKVSLDRASGDVTYSIRAASKPRATLARLGYPYVRFCQSRFRRDSLAAMRRAIGSH